MVQTGRSFTFRVLRFIRRVIDFTTAFVFGLFYGRRKCVPPVQDGVLLLSATEIASKVRRKELKSEDVVRSYIARIRQVQPMINAVVEDRFEDALAEARRIDEMVASGGKSAQELEDSFPLLGVPFSIKEHICVKNMRCTNGLVVVKDNVSDVDSDVVKLARDAGGIPLVTTNVPESLLGWESTNNVYGTCCNPYDTRRTCGGSSGGEGALIAAAGSVVGIGSDLGGSVRLPAVMNGIFGHKASSGIIPNGGVTSYLAKEVLKYAALGPLCRYADDLLPMLKVMTKDDPTLKLSEPVDLKKLKIYYAEENGCPLASPVVPAVRKSMKKALDHFRSTYGIEPTEVRFKHLGESAEFWSHVMVEAHPEPFSEMMTAGHGKISPYREMLKWCFRSSDHTLLSLWNNVMISFLTNRDLKVGHKEALERFHRLKAQFDEILKDENSVFLCPTQPQPAPYHYETVTKPWNIGYTSIFNVLLYPVTCFPTTPAEDGLPVGLQCVANIYNDRVTIAVAKELGRVFGGWTPPSI